jgi:hypothetical protein
MLFIYSIVLFTSFNALRQKEIIPSESTERLALLELTNSFMTNKASKKLLL